MMTRKTKSVNFQKILYTHASLKNKNRFFIKTPLKHGLDAALEATACLYQMVCIHVGCHVHDGGIYPVLCGLLVGFRLNNT